MQIVQSLTMKFIYLSHFVKSNNQENPTVVMVKKQESTVTVTEKQKQTMMIKEKHAVGRTMRQTAAMTLQLKEAAVSKCSESSPPISDKGTLGTLFAAALTLTHKSATTKHSKAQQECAKKPS